MTRAKNDPLKFGPLAVRPHVRDGEFSGRWTLDIPPHISPDGKRQRRLFPTKTEATDEAKRLLRELQLEGAIRGYGPKLANLTFSELSKAWLDEQGDRVATGKKRASTLVTDGYKLKALSAKFASFDVAKIGNKEIAQYQAERVAAGCAPPTINGETGILLQLLKWGHEKGFVERLPKVESIPVPVKRVDIPTQTEMTKILDSLPPKTALLVRFLAETGCRKGEAFALEWSDIDEPNELVTIRRKSGFTPKTRHSDRDIPITKSLLTALAAARKDERMKALAAGVEPPRWVFPGKGGVQRVDFRKALASAIKKAKIIRRGEPLQLTPHGLRKAMAPWLHTQGVSDAILQPRLGHAPGSRVTASTYVKVTTDDMRRVVIDLDAERASKKVAR
jgi:integrase